MTTTTKTSRRGFLLVYRDHDGAIRCMDEPLRSFNHAAPAAAAVLEGRRLAGSAAARNFGNGLCQRPIGTILEHRSGLSFRILCADFTVDGAAITPGRRLFNYYDAEWGTVAPQQFMSGSPFAPGGEYFGHEPWYDFVNEAGYVRKLNGERLATERPPR